NATESSDIDILVEFGEGKSLLDLIRLEMKIEEVLNKKVDVITFNSIHPYLKESILSEQVVFVEYYFFASELAENKMRLCLYANMTKSNNDISFQH
ncbi:unnamed protein product, partial [marine sediment metagenome]